VYPTTNHLNLATQRDFSTMGYFSMSKEMLTANKRWNGGDDELNEQPRKRSFNPVILPPRPIAGLRENDANNSAIPVLPSISTTFSDNYALHSSILKVFSCTAWGKSRSREGIHSAIMASIRKNTILSCKTQRASKGRKR
jgi:hypothetical protein